MTRRIDALAHVYARSLYELAEKAGGRDKIVEVAEELEGVCELARGDHAIREFLASPLIERTKRGATLRRIFHEKITDLVLRFLLVLNDKGRLGHLEPICDAYEQLVHEAFGRVEVDVYTPQPLSGDQRATLEQRIGASLGKEPVIHSHTDPNMIGGLKLRIGDELIDGSVASRLRRMRQNLIGAGGTAVRSRIAEIIEDTDQGGES